MTEFQPGDRVRVIRRSHPENYDGGDDWTGRTGTYVKHDPEDHYLPHKINIVRNDNQYESQWSGEWWVYQVEKIEEPATVDDGSGYTPGQAVEYNGQRRLYLAKSGTWLYIIDGIGGPSLRVRPDEIKPWEEYLNVAPGDIIGDSTGEAMFVVLKTSGADTTTVWDVEDRHVDLRPHRFARHIYKILNPEDL